MTDYLSYRRHRDNAKCRPAPLYIAMDQFDLSFTPEEVETVRQSWADGMFYTAIADVLERPWQEIMVLLMDLDSEGKIDARKGGWRGNYGKA